MMAIEEIRQDLFRLINNTDDGNLLEALKEVLESKKPLPYAHHEPTMEEIMMVREGEAQLKRGEGVPHAEVIKRIRERRGYKK
ncbi:hypothetical protein BH09BAC1_BH09BAC1_06750 [soil metagenome]